MKKQILNLGTVLHKDTQKIITGGFIIEDKPCHKQCIPPIGECIQGLCWFL